MYFITYYQQNTSHGVFAKVELLLLCYQYRYITENPEHYLPDDYCVIYGTEVIPITSIIGAAIPPRSVIKWTETGIKRFNNEVIICILCGYKWF